MDHVLVRVMEVEGPQLRRPYPEQCLLHGRHSRNISKRRGGRKGRKRKKKREKEMEGYPLGDKLGVQVGCSAGREWVHRAVCGRRTQQVLGAHGASCDTGMKNRRGNQATSM